MSKLTTTPTYESLFNQSRATLVAIEPFNWLALLFGVIGLVASAITIFIILRTAELRKSIHHLNVVHLSLASSVRCFAAILVNSKKIYLVLSEGVDIGSPGACLPWLLLPAFGLIAQSALHVALSLSRVLALVWPLWFYTTSASHMQFLNALFWLISLCLTLYRLYGFKADVVIIPRCDDSMVLIPDVIVTNKLILDTLRYVVIASMAIFVGVLWLKRNQSVQSFGASSTQLIRIASRNSLIVIVVFVIFIAVPRFVTPEILKAAGADATVMAAASNYAGLAQIAEPFFNLMVFLVFDSLFRSAARKIFARGSAGVSVHVRPTDSSANDWTAHGQRQTHHQT